MPTHISPTQQEKQRSLAAIVITDAVGFSRRMSQDEDAALALINQDLQLISALCCEFQGSILKTTGDGVLMYFISAVQAVSCAIEIQSRFLASSEKVSVSQHFVHRIGIHLGDIFFNNGDIMGSAVNITARLEAEAKPGSICMSQVVYEVVKSRLRLEASYAGELSLKNIEEYVSAYHVAPEKPEVTKEAEVVSELAAPFIVPLNNTLKALSVHSNSYKMKELLFAIQQGKAEADETVLAGTSLKLLLESLTENNLTLSACKESLDQAVNLLGCAEEYGTVADAIVESLQDFYREYEESPRVSILDTEGFKVETPEIETPEIETPEAETPDIEIPEAKECSANQHLAEQASHSHHLAEQDLAHSSLQHRSVKSLQIALATRLEQNDHRIQIKKLLYCICCNQWEEAIDRIESIPMLPIVQELQKQVESLTVLQHRLEAMVTAYGLEEPFSTIIRHIISDCSVLYDEKKYISY